MVSLPIFSWILDVSVFMLIQFFIFCLTRLLTTDCFGQLIIFVSNLASIDLVIRFYVFLLYSSVFVFYVTDQLVYYYGSLTLAIFFFQSLGICTEEFGVLGIERETFEFAHSGSGVWNFAGKNDCSCEW